MGHYDIQTSCAYLSCHRRLEKNRPLFYHFLSLGHFTYFYIHIYPPPLDGTHGYVRCGLWGGGLFFPTWCGAEATCVPAAHSRRMVEANSWPALRDVAHIELVTQHTSQHTKPHTHTHTLCAHVVSFAWVYRPHAVTVFKNRATSGQCHGCSQPLAKTRITGLDNSETRCCQKGPPCPI